MAHTCNSNNNAPATAVVGSFVAQGRDKKVPAKKKDRPDKTTQSPQVVMPPETGEAFNVVKGAMEMFTTFMENQGQRGDQTPPHTGRRDGSVSSRDTIAAAVVSMEAFSSAVDFAKSLEGKKQKRRVERDQNKKVRTTGGFNGSIGGGNQGVPSKGSLVPAQSTPHTSGSLPSIYSQGNGSQSRQNQNFRTPISQSQSSVR
ncbi:hypothetical protein HAX54_020383 [Datura stramonium]|uniref:Uncharacterized protein n=1 Tax=Datura stramonium TaxID=4076 RepID=A0ABS8UTU8_DATST|nr:hypothetical protein [Datura stramonium]